MKNSLILVFLTVLIASCTSTATRYEQLPSNNSNTRVKSLIMHFTAIDYEASVRALVDKDGLSSHYLVPESNDPSYPYDELKILQLVDEKERAWHAGLSYWQGRTGLNDTSIGIEIVNVPKCEQQQDALLKAEHGTTRLCVFPDFDPKQLALVIELSKGILERNPDIEPTAVIGHSDIAPSRKNDPAHAFHGSNCMRKVLVHGTTKKRLHPIGNASLKTLFRLAYYRPPFIHTATALCRQA